MSAHTPGPWVYAKAKQPSGSERSMDWCIATTDHAIIAEAYEIFGYDTDGVTYRRAPAEANARLIAAAPDLLEACQTFAEWLRREEAGGTNELWKGKRDTPEGERAWREWYDENLRICSLAQSQARAALAKAGL
jgi:hypothetical protein